MSPRPLRRSQAVVPFGVGAMIDFPGPVSLIHCGLDAWPFDENDPDHREFKIEDDRRLADRLNVEYFVQPPDYRQPSRGAAAAEPNLRLYLPFLRFPRWHVCPRCGRMYEAALHDREPPSCEGPVATGKDAGEPHRSRTTIQVRFVAACVHGHIQDFPWWEWVFQDDRPDTRGRRLRMNTSGSASLAGVRIICEKAETPVKAVARRTLAGAFGLDLEEQSPLTRIGVACTGHNPSLGIPSAVTDPPGCGQELRPLLRGGANVYFPLVVSSIYLPPLDESAREEALEVLEDLRSWQFIKMSSQARDHTIDVDTARALLENFHPQRNIMPEELVEAANRRLAGEPAPTDEAVEGDSDEQRFRRQEFQLFCRDQTEGYPKTNLLTRAADLEDYLPVIRDMFDRVTLVHRLRETRAFVGYSRVFPGNDLTDRDRRALLSRTPKVWLPAVIVRGEGLFVVMREERIRAWLRDHEELLWERIGEMQKTLDRLRTRRRQDERQVSPRFVLLHTFAHLMINQLVFESGYGSASLRERIYCSDDPHHPMAGILIYTAAGDSEGTMGGLVRMGQPGRLEGVILRALDNSRWCSSDPVCIESKGQGPDSCNLAACHSCSLLPETSCEEQNRLLDRGVVVGTISDPEIGFFRSPRPATGRPGPDAGGRVG